MRTFAIDYPLHISVISLRLLKEIDGRKFKNESPGWKLKSGCSLSSIEKRPQCCRSRIADGSYPLYQAWSIGADCLEHCEERVTCEACSGAMWWINEICQVFEIEWRQVWHIFVDFALGLDIWIARVTFRWKLKKLTYHSEFLFLNFISF